MSVPRLATALTGPLPHLERHLLNATPTVEHWFRAQWQEVPDNDEYDNGFKAQWEMFLRHVAEDAPWNYGLEAGAKGVQLAELGLKSWAERRWLDVPALEI